MSAAALLSQTLEMITLAAAKACAPWPVGRKPLQGVNAGALECCGQLRPQGLEPSPLSADEPGLLTSGWQARGALWCRGPSTQSADMHQSLTGCQDLCQGLGTQW